MGSNTLIPKVTFGSILLLSLLLSGHATSQSLFDTDTKLRLELTANFSAMDKVREQTDATYSPAVLKILDGENVLDSFVVEVKPRGKSRLERCSFPLLFLRFSATDLSNTPFANQDVLPITTHCRPQSSYKQYLHREYLVYKTYELLTEKSLRTRLVSIKYIDKGGRKKPIERVAVFVEHFDAIAERLSAEIETSQVPIKQMAQSEFALLEVFQYLVGNTDWSVPFGHNVLLLRSGDNVIPVPFDFDSSGAVNAPYAVVSEKLNIRNVTQRLFRGFCKSGTLTNDAVETILEKKAAILGLVHEHDAMDSRFRDRLEKFYTVFFEIVENPKLREKRILDACREI